MSHLPQQQLKFSKELFAELELPDLLINICSYAEYIKHDRVLNLYCQCCVECAFEKWSDEYLNFSFVMKNLLRNNKNFADFSKIFSADKNKTCCLIKKY